MEHGGVLVRFGELGIKSPPVRNQMLNRLKQNLLDAMLRESVEGNVERMGSRLWMVGPDTDALLAIATRSFGVVSASPVVRTDATMDAMSDAAIALALDAPDWTSFGVRSRREGEHGFTSKDMGIEIGSAVFTAAEADGRSPKVDLTTPDLEVHVEARGKDAFVFTSIHDGPGGLPAGAQGQVVCLMDRPDALVAAWLMLRRGCKVILAHSGDPDPDHIRILHRWGGPDTSHPLSGDDAVDAAWQGFRVDAVVTAETLQDDLIVRPDIPVLRPLCGLVDGHVAELRERIRSAA